MPHSSLTRRQFTLDAALALLAGCVITVTEGCSKDKTPTTPTPAPPVDIIASVITANHGHAVTITGAQITAGNAVTLNVQGTAPHNHTVTISQNDLLSLKNRQAITVPSTTDNNHQHSVTFTPA